MVFKLAGHYPTTQAYTDRFASLFLPCVFIIFITFIILKCTYLVNKDYKRLKIGPSFRAEYPNWQFKWWVQLVSVFTNISLQSDCQQTRPLIPCTAKTVFGSGNPSKKQELNKNSIEISIKGGHTRSILFFLFFFKKGC